MPKQTERKNPSDTELLLAKKITEDVCAQFMDWLGHQGEEASFNLKQSIYHRVTEAFKNGVEI